MPTAFVRQVDDDQVVAVEDDAMVAPAPPVPDAMAMATVELDAASIPRCVQDAEPPPRMSGTRRWFWPRSALLAAIALLMLAGLAVTNDRARPSDQERHPSTGPAAPHDRAPPLAPPSLTSSPIARRGPRTPPSPPSPPPPCSPPPPEPRPLSPEPRPLSPPPFSPSPSPPRRPKPLLPLPPPPPEPGGAPFHGICGLGCCAGCPADWATRAAQQAWLAAADAAPSNERMQRYLGGVYALTSEAALASIAVRDLHFFWQHVPGRRTFAVTWACIDCGTALSDGSLFAPLQDAYLSPSVLRSYPGYARCRGDMTCEARLAGDQFTASQIAFPGFFVQRTATAAAFAEGVPDDTWVEVMRISRVDESVLYTPLPLGMPLDAATVGQVYFWLAPGSGIWLHTGRSLKLVRGAHGTLTHTERHPNCEQARLDGYDTIHQQFAEFAGFTYEIIDCRGAALPTASEHWVPACPPPHVRLLAGVPADRYAPALLGIAPAPRPCVCDRGLDRLNCFGAAGDATSADALRAPPPPRISPPAPPPPLQRWTEHPGLNCFQGVGASDAEPRPNDYHFFVTLAGCQESCVQLSGCTAVTVSRRDGLFDCYRRASIHTARCWAGTEFSTFTLDREGA